MLRKILKIYLRFVSIVVIEKYKPFIIGITGNTGKTTTKDVVFCVLNKAFPNGVRKTEENLNTDIGVPISILGLTNAGNSFVGWVKNISKTIKLLIIKDKNFPKYLILELAADKPGEIEYFVKFIPINIGIVTTIGKHPVHLEYFPSRNALVEEKEWLVKGIVDGGTAILNKDDKDVSNMRESANKSVKVITYGNNIDSNVRFSVKEKGFDDTKNPEYYQKIEISCDISDKDKKEMVVKNFMGEGILYALTSAISCGIVLGISIDDSINTLVSTLKPSSRRMELIRNKNGFLVIDDAYNASPASYVNAIDAVGASLGHKTRNILVLGDMAELGEDIEKIHTDILEKAVKIADRLVLVGKNMHNSAKKLNLSSQVILAEDAKEAAEIVNKEMRKNDIVLVKGAKVMNMSLVVEKLTK